jgi:hypothetical protein
VPGAANGSATASTFEGRGLVALATQLGAQVGEAEGIRDEIGVFGLVASRLVAQARALHGQELRVDAGLDAQGGVGRLELVAHLEVELTRWPREHREGGAFHLEPPQLVEHFASQAGQCAERAFQVRITGAGGTHRAREGLFADHFPAHQQAAQIRRPALARGAGDAPIAEEDLALPLLRAQQQHPGLPGQADDLKDVAEPQVFEAPDQTHPHLRTDLGAGAFPPTRVQGDESAGDRWT